MPAHPAFSAGPGPLLRRCRLGEYVLVRTDPPVFLSRIGGRPVRSSDGVRAGRVVDMTIMYDIAHPTVHRLGVGRGRRIHYFCPGGSCRPMTRRG